MEARDDYHHHHHLNSSTIIPALEDVVSFHPSYLWLYIHLFNSARPTLLPHEKQR